MKYLDELKQQEAGYKDIRFTIRSCREEKDTCILFKPDGKYYSPLRIKTRKKYVTVEKYGNTSNCCKTFKKLEEAQEYIYQELHGDLSRFWLV